MIDYIEQRIYEREKITIEEQLHMYERHPQKSERNAVLWHAWQQNKQWLIQLLELTIASFPAYSRHNASHAKAVLYNIERILGEDRIKKLEPTDCFALLHAVYIHDIGMAILADDREEMILSDEFADMIDELALDSDFDLKKAALELKRTCYKYQKDNELIDKGGEAHLIEQKRIYQEKLYTYYAIIQLMAEFQRGKHGEKAASKISSWISDQDKLRSEFAMSGIPMRIFLRIADCASLHTEWDFQHIMDLPFEENGYEHDMLHPRFVAVLLQLGDVLDIDNDRFHPFAQAFLGKLPMQSQAHYDKHMAVRTFKVTPEEILIEADCVSREAMRLVRKDCDALEKLLESSSYHWSNIAPRKLGGALPTLQPPKLLLKGTEIPTDLAMMRFQISQRKAFSLLQGENIYSGRFPFVRELLQNAIDSTKIQCWYDYISSSKFRYKKVQREQKLPSILAVAQIVNPIEYPVEIEIRCGKQNEKNEWSEVKFDEIDSVDGKNEQYGILFSIRDYGTGISTEVLRDIADVGTSYKKRKKKIRHIPEWLRPTGEFGIGLQSVFLVSDTFFCETYTRSGERYRVEFRTGANGEQGYINVEPKNAENDPMPYGSEFGVFISHKKKISRDEFIEAWQGYDPFDINYERDAIKRDIVELTSQLILDIDKQLGELLFPIYVHLGFPFEDFYKAKLNNRIRRIVLDMTTDFQGHTEQTMKRNVSWIYSFGKEDNDNFISFDMVNGICAFDLKNMKLYMWLENISTCARLGVERILEDPYKNNKNLCQIFFKGIWAEEAAISGDTELLEMIDIKGGKMENNCLQLNRNGFTSKGNEHIEKIIVPEILKGAKEALGIIAREAMAVVDEQGFENRKELMFEKLVAKYLQEELAIELDENKSLHTNWKGQLLGISLFYHFYMMYSKREQSGFVSSKTLNERIHWNNTMKEVEKLFEQKKHEIFGKNKQDIIINISVPLLKMKDNDKYAVVGAEIINTADFFDQENHFLLISRRKEKGAEWINFLVKLVDDKDGEDGIIERIKKPVFTERDEKEKQNWLNKWGKYILNNLAGIVGESSIEQSMLLQKLLKYVPIIGCFSDKTGNIRIHVMSGYPMEYIYYDDNSKYLHMRKMERRHQKTNAERFVVFPYCGYEMIKIERYPSDACSVHDNYVFDIGYRMLFPCSGKALAELFSECGKMEINGNMRLIGEELRRVCEFEYEYYEGQDHSLKNKFEDKRREYVFEQKRPYNRSQFLTLIKTGYRIFINARTRMLIESGDIEKGENDKLPDYDVIVRDIRGLCHALLDESGDIIEGRNIESEHLEKGCIYYLDKIIGYVKCWNTKYYIESEQKIFNCVNDIKRRYWDGTKQKELMVEWTVQHTPYKKDVVSEMYDKLWKDIDGVMVNSWKNQETSFADWEVLNIIREAENKVNE